MVIICQTVQAGVLEHADKPTHGRTLPLSPCYIVDKHNTTWFLYSPLTAFELMFSVTSVSISRFAKATYTL